MRPGPIVVTLFGAALLAILSGLVRPDDDRAALQRALDTALDDERHAIAFYEAVMARHGERRPFANIVHAERRHAAALIEEYERLRIPIPANAWADREIEVPATFREACDASIVAEVRNVRVYDRLLAEMNDDAVRAVFVRLRRASKERHLPAFQRHGSGWEALDATILDERRSAQRDRALAARDAMFAALFGELTSALAEGGPPQAIAVCAERAEALAAEVAAEHGVRIGRTSWKLRNPKNRPPVWGELLVDERADTPRIMADRAGRLGVLTPIRLAGACLQCHGGAEQLGPGVAESLQRLYPRDEATGFAEGDLRGWFWIEVPAERGT